MRFPFARTLRTDSNLQSEQFSSGLSRHNLVYGSNIPTTVSPAEAKWCVPSDTKNSGRMLALRVPLGTLNFNEQC